MSLFQAGGESCQVTLRLHYIDLVLDQAPQFSEELPRVSNDDLEVSRIMLQGEAEAVDGVCV